MHSGDERRRGEARRVEERRGNETLGAYTRSRLHAHYRTTTTPPRVTTTHMQHALGRAREYALSLTFPHVFHACNRAAAAATVLTVGAPVRALVRLDGHLERRPASRLPKL